MPKLISLLFLLAVFSPLASANGSTLHILLQEWRMVTDTKTVKAGPVQMLVRNGGKETHELVVLRSDKPFDSLPMKMDGGINEDISGEVIDEIEDIIPGSDRQLNVLLRPGRYVILCNMVEEEAGKREEHYSMGMRAQLVVE